MRLLTHITKTLLGAAVNTNRLPVLSLLSRKMSAINYDFTVLRVTRPRDFVVQVELNRPEKRNAMNRAVWDEMKECFDRLSVDKDCRAVVLSGAGPMFTAGIDLSLLQELATTIADEESDPARRAVAGVPVIRVLQECVSSIEKCSKPVIAAMHSACVGGGVDVSATCDIRYCSQDAWFQVKETDLGIAADIGTLQRFPLVIGNDSLTRELIMTGRKFYSDEAKSIGYVSRVFPDRQSLMDGSLDLASEIASKSPVAMQTIKKSLNYSRDHTVQEGLDHIALLNSVMIQGEDTGKAAMAQMSKEKAVFSKL
ncbi:hypothetical protein ScPMuIL_013521 [Solemya velum]